MVKQIFKYSLRTLKRQGGYVFINVLGLAVGLACTLLIALFIVHELSYDKYHEHRDQIYRIGLHGRFSGQESRMAYTAPPIVPSMAEEFPEVENFLRMYIWDETVIQVEDRYYTEDHLAMVDSTFFDFFSIPLLRGNQQTALTEPYSVVLSETTARRLFGDEDPMDKLLKAGGMEDQFRVTGIMADVPENTHFRAGMLGSITSHDFANENNWLSNHLFSYVKLRPGADPEMVSDRFEGLIMKYIGPMIREFMGITIEDFLASGNAYNFFLQPLTGIHLDPSVESDHRPPNDPKYLWIFGTIGVLIIVIASINFMNLSTAQATRRAREVGMKKVVGSSRGMLVRQFMSETVILAFLAMLVAIMFVEVSLPYFNNLLSLHLSLSYLDSWYVIPLLLLLIFIVGLFAGAYPAFYLSSFQPAAVLKGKSNGKQNTRFRMALTVLQFVISIMLITGSVIMYRQLNYMINKDLGFDKESVLVLRRAYVLGGQVDAFKTELQGIPGVVSVSASTAVPGRSDNHNAYTLQGRSDETFLFQTTFADYDFLETYGIELAAGRYFDPDTRTDRDACLINERAVRNLELDDPFATRVINIGDGPPGLPVIGLLKDYHFESLRMDINPAIIVFKNEDIHGGYVSIRYEPHMLRRILEETETLWDSFTTSQPMLYFFMDEDFNRLYREERQNAQLSVIFTLLAIFIATMGLYGLTAFSLQQRIKEIGVRKTFGAGVSSIWFMISKEILALVALATLLAWPLIYWIAGNWLQNYQYRITMQLQDFLLGFLIAVVIALASISYRVIRTASMNPSISLRYE